MAISAQDKILYVANKLGLSTLKDMQGSTGAVYDTVSGASQGEFFTNASQHVFVNETNVTDNEFEVNEALLIESIGFNQMGNGENTIRSNGTLAITKIVFQVVIGNKVVLKDMLWTAGSDTTFVAQGGTGTTRAFIDMESVGILIPPQVRYHVSAQFFDFNGNPVVPEVDEGVGCVLYGTQVLLNFNTSI